VLLCGITSRGSAQDGSTLDELLDSGIWLNFNAGLRDLDVHAIAFDPGQPNRMYAAGDGTIYRSLNGGELWHSVYVLRSGGRESDRSSRRRATATDVDGLTDDQLRLVEDRFGALERDLFDEVASDFDEFTAALVVESEADELLQQALDEVLSEVSVEAGGEDLRAFSILDSLPENRFTQLVVDPESTGTVYAASGHGLFRSSNYGESWSRVFRGVGDEGRRIFSIALTPAAAVIGTGSGIYRSMDGGETWTQVVGPPGDSPVRFIASAPSRPQRLYGIADGRVIRSDDGGEHWTLMATRAGTRADEFANLIVDRLEADLFYAATRDGLLWSENAGASIGTRVTVGLPSRAVTWVEQAGGTLIVATGNGVYALTGGGEGWREVSSGLVASIVHQIRVDPSGRLWIGTDLGIFRLTEAGEWFFDDEAARRANDYWAQEPTLGQTVAAALWFYGYAELPIAVWDREIWWSRFMPRARLRYTLQQSRDETFVQRLEAGDLSSISEGVIRQDDDEIQIRFMWDLGDILFDTREISVRNTGERLTGRRTGLVSRTVSLYEGRRELMLRIAAGVPTTLGRRLTDLLELRELTARLDVVTGGYFTAYSQLGGE
jgi:photosystem II stability/assembly factor-like uncharacterized protein